MERKIILRTAAGNDIESILVAQRASPEHTAWTAADYTSVLAADGTICLLAEDGVWERVASFLLARTTAGDMEVLNLAVAPEYRRRDIARCLLAAAPAP